MSGAAGSSVPKKSQLDQCAGHRHWLPTSRCNMDPWGNPALPGWEDKEGQGLGAFPLEDTC